MTPLNLIEELQSEYPDKAEHLEQFARYKPALLELQKRIDEDDPVAREALNQIACYLCDICAHIGLSYDPMAVLVIAQEVCAKMAERNDQWSAYTREIAPRANARKLRTQQDRS